MKNIINIFLNDVKNILSKRAAIIVIVALMILPSMYAWFNIIPSWDPYANTAGVAVAVTNLDRGATAEGKSFNVGDEIIKSLEENDKLGWVFVDEEPAIKGVEHGDYYAAIIIPENFSERLVSVLDDYPEQPVLDYYINEKINAIAPKVTNAGASGIVESIQSGFVKVTNEAIFSVFNEIGIELESNRTEIERFVETVYELEADMPEIERMLALADTDLGQVESALVRANQGMVRADELLIQAGDASALIDEKLVSSNELIREYGPFIISNLEIAQGLVQLVPGTIERIEAHSEEIDQALERIEEEKVKLDKAIDVLEILSDILVQAEDQLVNERKLEIFNEQLKEGLVRLEKAEVLLNDVLYKLESSDIDFEAKLVELDAELAKAIEKLEDFQISYQDVIKPAITEGLGQLTEMEDKLGDIIAGAQDKNQEEIDKIQGWIDGDGEGISIEEQLEYIESAQAELEKMQDELKSLQRALELANQVQPDPKYDLALVAIAEAQGKLDELAEELNEAHARLEAGEDLTEDVWPEVVDKLEGLGESLDKVADKQEDISASLGDAIINIEAKGQEIEISLDKIIIKLHEGKAITEQILASDFSLDDIKAQLHNLADKLAEIDALVHRLVQANEEIQVLIDDGWIGEARDKVDQMLADMIRLRELIDTVVSQVPYYRDQATEALAEIKALAIEIDEGLTDLLTYIDDELIPTYLDAFDRANHALDEANRMMEQANEAFPQIYKILAQVDEGLVKGNEGLAKAWDVFPNARAKITEVADKIRALEEQGDLDKIIRLMKNDPNAESDFLAEPIFLEEHQFFPIPNYGSAMAPFFTAMSLWVGGLILVSSLIVDVPGKDRYKSYEAYLGRFITFWLLGLMQALIVTSGNLFLLKTYVTHKIFYILFAFIISTTFVVIIYTLVSVFGNTGKVVAIILLVMQLGASGGTFPIQMTPDFFQNIHAFMPFTHALGLFREAVGGIIWPLVWKHIAWLVGYIVIFLFIGIKLKATINKNSDKFLEEARESGIIL